MQDFFPAGNTGLLFSSLPAPKPRFDYHMQPHSSIFIRSQAVTATLNGGAFTQRRHSAGTVPIITLFIPGTPLKTTHLQKDA